MAEKIKAFGDGGATCTIQQMLPYGVSGGAKNMTPGQFAAYERAKLTADKRNQGDLEKAKQILEAAGFEVYWA